MHGHALDFGVSGLLYNNGVLMYDHQTQSLWSQIGAQGSPTPLSGYRLALPPSGTLPRRTGATATRIPWCLHRTPTRRVPIPGISRGYGNSGTIGLPVTTPGPVLSPKRPGDWPGAERSFHALPLRRTGQAPRGNLRYRRDRYGSTSIHDTRPASWRTLWVTRFPASSSIGLPKWHPSVPQGVRSPVTRRTTPSGRTSAIGRGNREKPCQRERPVRRIHVAYRPGLLHLH
ncbi:MAG TPA: DUF3179 domain-containing (seleno)protein [Gammaproteobacteria bacterium]|nr:DUF3179 domain-containing (seleno)protein [Gammaproteobacteria bacterium]